MAADDLSAFFALWLISTTSLYKKWTLLSFYFQMKGRAKSGSQKLRAKAPGSWELGAEEFLALIFNWLFGSGSAPTFWKPGAAPKKVGSPALHNVVLKFIKKKKKSFFSKPYHW